MKDLFKSVFSNISAIEPDTYFQGYVRKAPFWLLDAAVRAHEDVRSCAALEPVHALLSKQAELHWNDPELYPHLMSLLGTRESRGDARTHIWALQGHLGLRDVDREMFSHRYFRRHGTVPGVYELDAGEIRPVANAMLMHEPGLPIVYRPVPHLFDDVVGAGIAYEGKALPRSGQEMISAVRSAIDLVWRYDADLHQGVTSAVGVIALTGDWHPGNRTSYSMGKTYTGGVFSSLCTDSPALLAESLIHEYYHQRIWQWWQIEAPSDLPSIDMTMISTVSGHERPVPVMMHALLIYVSLVDFYRWAETACSDESHWIRHRWQTLKVGATTLRKALRDRLHARPECQRFVEVVAAHLH